MSRSQGQSRRGQTSRGRARAQTRQQAAAIWSRRPEARPLYQSEDHGRPIVLTHADVGALDRERWTEPFLAANRSHLERLRLTTETQAGRDGVRVLLHPRERIGSMPLLSPTTRRVVAGLLIRPRFGWSSVGRVLAGVGFGIAPELGGAPLVPGSAREVPPWILAGPVLARISALVRELDRGFVSATHMRTQPRGRVDWTRYARDSLATGQWQRFPCTFSDLADDPWLLAVLRWTVQRIAVDLGPSSDSALGKRLLEQTRWLLTALGTGPAHRPATDELAQRGDTGMAHAALVSGLEAVGWVRDERGLGGARTLDGLAWTLATDQLWEAWVESLFAEIARRTGARLASARRGDTRRPLVWHTPMRSLGHLAPDLALHWPDRTLWIDAKYKAHLLDLSMHGWSALPEAVRDAHRADLHQALAYTSLADTPRVDTWLVYPVSAALTDQAPLLHTEAEISGGARRIRLALLGLPLGFASHDAREHAIAQLSRTA